MNKVLGIFSGQRPDITPAQIIGGLAAAVGPVATLVGATLSQAQLDAVSDLKGIGIALIGGDALIRIGRNVKDGMVQGAALSAPVEPPDASLPGAVDAGVPAEHVAAALVQHIEGTGAPSVESDSLSPDEVEAADAATGPVPAHSSDPEADAIDAANLPSDDEEEKS